MLITLARSVRVQTARAQRAYKARAMASLISTAPRDAERVAVEQDGSVAVFPEPGAPVGVVDLAAGYVEEHEDEDATREQVSQVDDLLASTFWDPAHWVGSGGG